MPIETNRTAEEWQGCVERELARARQKHPAKVSGPHDGYSKILEELDEYWDEVREQCERPGRMFSELVQIAAMAQRVAEDLDLLNRAVPPARPLKSECQRCNGSGNLCNVCGESEPACNCGQRNFYTCPECGGKGI